MLKLNEITSRAFLERPRGSYSVDDCLADLFDTEREIAFCFREVTTASALSNSPPTDDLVDPPDLAPLMEAGWLLSHKPSF